MAINSTNILQVLQKIAPSLSIFTLDEVRAAEALPVEVRWPFDDGSGETRRVIAAHIENSGTPEKPTLVLICGLVYSDDPEEMQYFPGQPVENINLYGPDVDAQATLEEDDPTHTEDHYNGDDRDPEPRHFDGEEYNDSDLPWS